MTFVEFIVFVIGACAGYAFGYWARLGLWSPLVAFVTGVAFVVGFIIVRILLLKR